MIQDLAAFEKLTKVDKFNLVNLPVQSVKRGTSFEHCILDICLALPTVRDTFQKEEVERLAVVVFKHKRKVK
jgi:hypothetical protein